MQVNVIFQDLKKTKNLTTNPKHESWILECHTCQVRRIILAKEKSKK